MGEMVYFVVDANEYNRLQTVLWPSLKTGVKQSLFLPLLHDYGEYLYCP